MSTKLIIEKTKDGYSFWHDLGLEEASSSVILSSFKDDLTKFILNAYINEVKHFETFFSLVDHIATEWNIEHKHSNLGRSNYMQNLEDSVKVLSLENDLLRTNLESLTKTLGKVVVSKRRSAEKDFVDSSKPLDEQTYSEYEENK